MEERERGLKIQEKGATIRPKAAPTVAPTPAATATGWKPSMTTAEASIWNKDSLVQGINLHGTTVEGKKGILKNGFDFDRSRTGSLYGSGAYQTKSARVSTLFADEGGATVKTMMKAKNPATISDEYSNFLWVLVHGQIPKNPITGEYIKGLSSRLTPEKRRIAKRYFDKNKDKMYFNPNKPKTFDYYVDHHYGMPHGDPDFIKKYKPGTKAYKDFNKTLDLSDRWFKYLDNEITKGNKDIIKWVERDAYMSPNAAEFPEYFRDFLVKEGYDALIIEDVYVHMVAEDIFDTYYISLFEENVVALID